MGEQLDYMFNCFELNIAYLYGNSVNEEKRNLTIFRDAELFYFFERGKKMKVEEVDRIDNVSDVFNVNIVAIPQQELNKQKRVLTNIVKRFVDIVVSFIGVICLIPLTLIIYISKKIK